MTQEVLRVGPLPETAIDAAATFHREWLDRARTLLAGPAAELVIVLPPARYDHADWRRALARDLAREAAPKRVNVVAGEGPALESALGYLVVAPGVTGQYLPLASGQAE